MEVSVTFCVMVQVEVEMMGGKWSVEMKVVVAVMVNGMQGVGEGGGGVMMGAA
jgi:hypothetical protein